MKTEAAVQRLGDADVWADVCFDPINDRIRMDDYHGEPARVLELVERANPAWSTKIILKVRTPDITVFASGGYREKVIVPEYFGGDDMHFLTRYPDPKREENLLRQENAIILATIRGQSPAPLVRDHTSVQVEAGLYADAVSIANIFKTVFEVYPTPMYEADYIRHTMEEGTRYAVVRSGNNPVAVASAEVNRRFGNAEITDCVTLPEFRGKGYNQAIVGSLCNGLRREGIHCLYTIARSGSFSINKVFNNLGFRYGGTLRNNVRIGSGFEDMNVWWHVGRQLPM